MQSYMQISVHFQVHSCPFQGGGSKSCSDHSMCPPWFICGSDKYCGNKHGGTITCDNKQVAAAVLDGNCACLQLFPKLHSNSCDYLYNEALSCKILGAVT